MKIEPGCLAVISKGFPAENIGLIVFIEQSEPETSKYHGQKYWTASCPTPIRCKDGKYKTTFIIAEACLRPISGPSIVKHVRLLDKLPSKVNA